MISGADPWTASAVTPESTAYDRRRDEVTWNRRLARSRSPALIASPRDVEEVAELVRLAALRSTKVGLRSGGHSYEAAALVDGAMLIDLGRLDRISIDPDARTAWIGPGVRGGRLLAALAGHGLAFPVGHCADVGLGGYLLSGGFGWNMGAWGPACASVLEVEAVLASGELVRADASRNSDLFWAARGAGAGFFAAVTGFRLALHPRPASVFAFMATFPARSADQLAEWLTAATRAAGREAEITCLIGPHVETGEPAIVLRAEAAAHTASEAHRRVEPLLALPGSIPRIGSVSERWLPFTELTEMPSIPDGKRVVADHLWSDAPIGALLLATMGLADGPCRMSSVNLFALGGEGGVRPAPDERRWALSKGGATAVGIYGVWDEPSDDARHVAWVKDVDAALAPYRTGRYVGEACLAERGRAKDCFTPAALERLERLRERHDPQGMFCSRL